MNGRKREEERGRETYFDNIGECGSQPQTENQPEDTIMCIPERSPHKRGKDD